MRLPRIAIDFRWLDQLSLCNGQYRYAVDLMRGLAELSAPAQFVVLGSRKTPAAEIQDLFEDADRWEYRPVPRIAGRGAWYREQLHYAWLLRRLNVDLVHELHCFVPLFSPVPVVATVYDMMLELFPEYAEILRSREYRLQRWAFRKRVAQAVAISQTTADDLQRLWQFPAERTKVVYLGPELPGPVSGKKENGPPLILAPYNLEPRKNLFKLMDALAKLKYVGWRFRLVLFGLAAVDGSRESEFQARLDELELRSCTTLTGRIPDERLAELYRQASVFAFPSLYEGFGLPALEAMSAGACVVAHNESAMREVVGDAGWLVDMRSVEAICGALVAAMHSPGLSERAAQRAKAFSPERMARETLAVYEKTLAALAREPQSDELAYPGQPIRQTPAENIGSD